MSLHKTSVHFINIKEDGNKIMVIPTFVLLYWKRFLLGTTIVLSVLLTIIGIFIYQRTSEHYQEELKRANYLKTQINLQQLKESFKSIDESILRINEFMSKRGLKKFEIENVGQNENFKIQNINEITSAYDESLKELEEVVSTIPIGFPHYGKITSQFGMRNNPFTGRSLESHGGIDFRGSVGEPIKSTANGKVIRAGYYGGYGKCVIIEHGFKHKTVYAHLSKINVKVGDKVKVGEIIGQLGNTGRSTGPHLHYEVQHKDNKKDPELYLNI